MRPPNARRIGVFAPFAYGEYRRYSMAATTVFTAHGIEMLVRGWLVHEMTHSPFLVALVPALMMLPMLAFTLIGGELADRFSRPRLVVIGDGLAMVWYAILAALVVSGRVEAWHVLALTAAHGVTGALMGPARQSMVSDLVPQGAQRGAIGLSSAAFNVAQIIGPAVGGVLIAKWGVGAATIAAAIIVLPALPVFAMLRPAAQTKSKTDGSIVHHLADGLRYVAGNSAIKWLLFAALALAVTVNAWGAMFPPLAVDVMGQGAEGLANLSMCVGIGAVLGTLVSVAIGGRNDHSVEIVSGFAFALLVAGVAVSPVFPLTLALATLAALAATTFFVTNMMAMQLNAAPEYRGRVISVRFLMFGLSPVGMLALGALAEETGPRMALTAFALTGAVLLAGVLLFMRPRKHNVVRG